MRIRAYGPEDRPAVRRLSCDTADQGKPINPLFDDREAVADVLTRYYTDGEPQSLWVAEHEGKVIGYLTGCLDTRRSNRVLTWKIVPGAAAAAVLRGALWHAKTWRLVAALGATALLGGIPKVDLDKYPAHFHVNVQEGFRGRQVGRRLVSRFMQQVEAAGIDGVHLVARGGNEAARRFFESMGFALLRQQPLVLPAERSFTRTSTVVYGWRRQA